ncbi:methyltransferase family protein [Kribbella speibonae]|uniref:Isoprenylcysteine carboxylmethyltransferase family protein n=1 Tax=Kribbella speibonae TaxID=1572660 RepID=A0A4R0J9C2_9ACTN|nr:isoprenylcysteine carboxylmethyltransferase family protein [Kribbella speibonae]TCC21088.1 isoprenylcysteine carboxylmethyltransferase family protein [Kribbella speibonae]TCC41096.1 isoprenylcysteine carboxylmethyltransferase family protein [Kribbella speibonae]
MTKAILGSAAFFFAAPCVVAGVLPWWLSGWAAPRFWPGFVIVAAGAFVVLRAFVRFVREGRGTPAPVAPTEELVVGGDYRFVRNPMYVGVVAAIFGQALVFLDWWVFGYGVVAWGVMASFVRWYEEPVLRARYGRQYEEYCRAVPAWVPRPARR